ncbi:raffinose/stachyose/melibiose transport system substrate-binding protein [Paenibacillus sp. DS2015]|uniref:ABC transporter substrate-binding protein n=1 Tax=Paenibacillus sp. DS2015 TaxID=3373917 RepID=UPI003D203649
MKKPLVMLSSIMLAFTVMLAGCGSSTNNAGDAGNSANTTTSEKKNITLDFMTNSADQVLEAYKEVAKKYEDANPGVKITITSQGKDYESLMKAKMAANDLPDLWMTHGWSVARYSPYLEKLNEQAWAGKIAPTLLPTITNSDGELYVLPLDIDKGAVVVNETVLKEAGVDSASLVTWNDFLEAFEKVKNIGKTPVGMGGKDPRVFAQFLDIMSTQMYIASPSNDDSAKLLDGTFDWSKWSEVSQLLVDLKDMGYLNKDVTTASGDSINELFAQDQVGFMFQTNSVIRSAVSYNPDLQAGFVPLPVVRDDGRQVLVGGERNAVGVWKDSKNKEEALAYLSFMSQEENMTLIAQAQGNTPAFSDYSIDFGMLTPYFERTKDIEIQPYFDRVYLPNGMWSTLQTVGSGLVSGGSIEGAAVKLMNDDFDRLFNVAK